MGSDNNLMNFAYVLRRPLKERGRAPWAVCGRPIIVPPANSWMGIKCNGILIICITQSLLNSNRLVKGVIVKTFGNTKLI